MEEEGEKNKTTEWPTFHRVLLKKTGEYLFSISLTYQMIVSFLVTRVVFHKVIFTVGIR